MACLIQWIQKRLLHSRRQSAPSARALPQEDCELRAYVPIESSIGTGKNEIENVKYSNDNNQNGNAAVAYETFTFSDQQTIALEAAFKCNNYPNLNAYKGLAKQTKVNEYYVVLWFMNRRQIDRTEKGFLDRKAHIIEKLQCTVCAREYNYLADFLLHVDHEHHVQGVVSQLEMERLAREKEEMKEVKKDEEEQIKVVTQVDRKLTKMVGHSVVVTKIEKPKMMKKIAEEKVEVEVHI